MLCPNCGAPAADDAAFCPECGHELNAVGKKPPSAKTSAPSSDAVFSFDTAPDPIHTDAHPEPDLDFAFDFTSADSEAAVPEASILEDTQDDFGFFSASSQETLPLEEDLPMMDLRKPIYKKWWFWVLAVGVLFILIMFAAALSSYLTGKNSADPPPSLADIQLTVPARETEAPEAAAETAPVEEDAAAPAEPDPDALSPEKCMELISQSLNATNYSYELAPGDNWLDVYVWADGMYDWAYNIRNGSEEYLPAWQDILSSLSALSVQYQVLLSENGHSDITVCLSLLDDTDQDYYLAVFIDGELLYDYATGVDLTDTYQAD